MLRSAGRFVRVNVRVDVHRDIGQARDLVQQGLAGRLGDPVASIDGQRTVAAKLSAAQLDLSQARTALATGRDSLSAAKTSAEQDLNRATQSLHQAQAG